jgi:hypothetical protein
MGKGGKTGGKGSMERMDIRKEVGRGGEGRKDGGMDVRDKEGEEG